MRLEDAKIGGRRGPLQPCQDRQPIIHALCVFPALAWEIPHDVRCASAEQMRESHCLKSPGAHGAPSATMRTDNSGRTGTPGVCALLWECCGTNALLADFPVFSAARLFCVVFAAHAAAGCCTTTWMTSVQDPFDHFGCAVRAGSVQSGRVAQSQTFL